MGHVLLGAVTGLALAAGMLGLQMQAVDETDTVLHHGPRTEEDPQVESFPPSGTSPATVTTNRRPTWLTYRAASRCS